MAHEAEHTTAVVEEGNKPYLITFLVHVKDLWMLLRLCSASCRLAVLWLQREWRGLRVEPELNLCINYFLHIFRLLH